MHFDIIFDFYKLAIVSIYFLYIGCIIILHMLIISKCYNLIVNPHCSTSKPKAYKNKFLQKVRNRIATTSFTRLLYKIIPSHIISIFTHLEIDQGHVLFFIPFFLQIIKKYLYNRRITLIHLSRFLDLLVLPCRSNDLILCSENANVFVRWSSWQIPVAHLQKQPLL